MSNPFESENGQFYVLVNEEGQHSLWPETVDVPKGWHVVYGREGRLACLSYVEHNWTDMRPKSLVAKMEASS
jgi:MbtH protein